MPQAASPNMQLILPTPGGDAGSWGDELNAAFVPLLDAHDHTTGKGVQITPPGLNLNADVSFQTHSATHLQSADFDEVAALSTGSRRLFWNSADHELYIRTAAGVNVKLTSGAGLNATLLGGIGGDYLSVGALLAFDDTTDRYLFQQEVSAAVRQFARLASADLDIYEFKAAGATPVPTRRVRLQSPVSLAADYAITMLAALPGAQSLLQVDNAGVLTASMTLPSAPTAPDYKYSTPQTLMIPAAMAEVGSGVTNNPVTFPFVVPAGMTITGYGFRVNKGTAAGTHLYGVLLQAQDDASATVVNADSGNATGPSSAWGVDDNSNSPGAQDMHPALVVTIAVTDVDHQYYLCISGSDSSTPAKTYDSYGNHKRWSLNSGVDFVMFAYVTLKRV
jgi:hypothetical protein